MRVGFVVIELFQGCLNGVFLFYDEDRAKAKARELIPSPAFDSERDKGDVPQGYKDEVSVWKADDLCGDILLMLTE